MFWIKHRKLIQEDFIFSILRNSFVERQKYFFLVSKVNKIYQFNYQHKFSRYAGQISKKFSSKNAFVDVVTFIFVSTNPGEIVFFAHNNINSNRRTWTKINVNQLNSIIVVCCFPRTFWLLACRLKYCVSRILTF